MKNPVIMALDDATARVLTNKVCVELSPRQIDRVLRSAAQAGGLSPMLNGLAQTRETFVGRVTRRGDRIRVVPTRLPALGGGAHAGG